MSTKFKRISIVAILLCFVALAVGNIQAVTPFYSYFIDSDGNYTWAPDLYVPSLQINYDFESPTGIFVDNQTSEVFVSQKSSVIHFDQFGNVKAVIGEGILKDGRDVFVRNNKVFVADNGSKKVFVFDEVGNLIKEYGRPESEIFGNETKFNPISIVVDATENLYIVSEQTSEGVIQLASNGRFTGFVGVNKAQKSTLRSLQEMIFPEELLNQLSKITPPTINTVEIDSRGLIYTITSGSVDVHVKKLNVAGRNIFEHNLSDSNYIKDMAMDGDGNVFLLYGDDGFINIFDSTGKKIAGFGSKTDNEIRDGLLRTPIGLEVNNNNDVFVLDSTLNLVQVYRKTELMSNVFVAMRQFMDGRYEEAQQTWQDVLNVNQNVAMAHRSIGMSYFKKQDFDNAMQSFKLANDKANFSESLWEVRQAWLMNNTHFLLLGFVLLIVCIAVIKRINKKFKIVHDDLSWIKKMKGHYMYHDLQLFKRVFKHPLDVFYDIRTNKVNINTGIVLAVVTLIVYTLSFYAKAYLFSEVDLQFSIVNAVLKFVLIVGLYMLSNYLICSIRDGQGSKKAVFIGTIYAMAPFIILLLPLSLMTQVLTYNERFLFDFAMNFMYAYTIILLVLSVMEIHAYSFKFSITNIITIIFTLLLIVIFTITFVVLSTEFINFIMSIIKEVMLRG